MSRNRSRSPYSARDRDRSRNISARDGDRPSDRRGRHHSGRERQTYKASERSRSRERSKRYRDDSRDRSRDGRDRDYRASYRPVREVEDDRRGYDSSERNRLSRSRSPTVDISKRPSRKNGEPFTEKQHQQQTTAKDDDSTGELQDDEAQIAAMMGFGGFGTTKGEKVHGNAKGGVAKPAKRIEYRQYMNRPGGFNRALDDVP